MTIEYCVYPQEQVAFSLQRLKSTRFDWVLLRDPERCETHPQIVSLKHPKSVRSVGERWLKRWARRQNVLVGPAFPVIHWRMPDGTPFVVVSAWGVRDPRPEHVAQLEGALAVNYRRDPIRCYSRCETPTG